MHEKNKKPQHTEYLSTGFFRNQYIWIFLIKCVDRIHSVSAGQGDGCLKILLSNVMAYELV